ncbi:MAG: hypothetical protein R3E00_07930 [Paracoccaceae bacterium]
MKVGFAGPGSTGAPTARDLSGGGHAAAGPLTFPAGGADHLALR